MRGVASGNTGWAIDVSTPLSAEDVPKIYALTPKCPTVDLLVTCLWSSSPRSLPRVGTRRLHTHLPARLRILSTPLFRPGDARAVYMCSHTGAGWVVGSCLKTSCSARSTLKLMPG